MTQKCGMGWDVYGYVSSQEGKMVFPTIDYGYHPHPHHFSNQPMEL